MKEIVVRMVKGIYLKMKGYQERRQNTRVGKLDKSFSNGCISCRKKVRAGISTDATKGAITYARMVLFD